MTTAHPQSVKYGVFRHYGHRYGLIRGWIMISAAYDTLKEAQERLEWFDDREGGKLEVRKMEVRR